MATLVKSADWQAIRKAYIEREVKPTYAELSAEFQVSMPRICIVANDESWGIARAERIEKRLACAETGQLIIERLSGERTIVDAGKDACLSVLRQLGSLAAGLSERKADSTRANVLNNISFALQNTCNALKLLGVLGAGKALPKDADGNIESFLKQINLQINTTVNGSAPITPSNSGEPVANVVEVKDLEKTESNTNELQK